MTNPLRCGLAGGVLFWAMSGYDGSVGFGGVWGGGGAVIFLLRVGWSIKKKKKWGYNVLTGPVTALNWSWYIAHSFFKPLHHKNIVYWQILINIFVLLSECQGMACYDGARLDINSCICNCGSGMTYDFITEECLGMPSRSRPARDA